MFVRSLLISIALFAFSAQAQTHTDWQNLGQLHASENIRLLLKKGPVESSFKTWTPQEISTGSVTADKDDVLRIERVKKGSRGKSAAIWGLVGFGAGFAIGEGVGGCNKQTQFCFSPSRGEIGAVFGGAGAVIGAGIGALFPHHTKEVIYSAQ